MLFHYTPAAGWMNDPNGLIHWNGRHHLFYQHNPHSTAFTDIGWGHASSADLITWQEHGEALRPGAGGSPYDVDGCYSGCAVVLDGQVKFVYTGVDGDLQLPCLAHAAGSDLATVTKDRANPAIKDWPRPDVEAFRDHTVHRRDGLWHQAIGGRTTGTGGAVFGYTSANLRDWRYDQLVLDANRSDIPDAVWECPDLFTVGEATTLIVSLLDHTGQLAAALPLVWYATGEWLDGRLHPHRTARLDHGDRFYAPQSYWTDDGRRIQFGWIRTDLDPAVSGPSRGVMSAPRELAIRDGKLRTTPAGELTALRAAPTRNHTRPGARSTVLSLEPAASVELAFDERDLQVTALHLVDDDTGHQFDLDLTDLPRPSAHGDPARLTLLFDHGIVELFRNGTPATWTDLSTPQISQIRIDHAPANGSTPITTWPLRHPLAHRNDPSSRRRDAGV